MPFSDLVSLNIFTAELKISSIIRKATSLARLLKQEGSLVKHGKDIQVFRRGFVKMSSMKKNDSMNKRRLAAQDPTLHLFLQLLRQLLHLHDRLRKISKYSKVPSKIWRMSRSKVASILWKKSCWPELVSPQQVLLMLTGMMWERRCSHGQRWNNGVKLDLLRRSLWQRRIDVGELHWQQCQNSARNQKPVSVSSLRWWFSWHKISNAAKLPSTCPSPIRCSDGRFLFQSLQWHGLAYSNSKI